MQPEITAVIERGVIESSAAAALYQDHGRAELSGRIEQSRRLLAAKFLQCLDIRTYCSVLIGSCTHFSEIISGVALGQLIPWKMKNGEAVAS